MIPAARSGARELLFLSLTALLAGPYLTGSAALDWRASAFAVAIVIVEFFDVELPRGDLSTMSMPVVANAVLFLNPPAALITVVGATILGLWASLGVGRRLILMPQALVRRLAVTLLGVAYVGLLGPTFASGLVGLLGLSLAMVSVDFVYAQVQSAARLSAPLSQLLAGSARLQGTLIAAKVSACVVGGLLFPEMAGWGLLVLTLMLLVMRQAFSLFVSVRKAYQSTIGALARTVEAQRPGKLGHSERAAELATEVARHLGFRGRDLEHLAYATLLHDLALLGESDNVALVDDTDTQHTAGEMLESVTFLRGVVPILHAAAGHGSEHPPPSRSVRLLAYIALAASRMDDIAHGEPSDEDGDRLRALGQLVLEQDRTDIEQAFRLSATRVQGALFTVGAEDVDERRVSE